MSNLSAPPFGRDTTCTTFVEHGRMSSGARLVAEALYRRYTSDRGSLEYDPDYGDNVERFCGRSMTDDEIATIPSELAAEGLKDPRVARVDVSVLRVGGAGLDITISGILKDTSEAFALALRVGDAKVELLRMSGGANG